MEVHIQCPEKNNFRNSGLCVIMPLGNSANGYGQGNLDYLAGIYSTAWKEVDGPAGVVGEVTRVFRAAAERAVEGVGHDGDLLCAGMGMDFFWLLNVYFAALMAATKVPLDGPKALPPPSARTLASPGPAVRKMWFRACEKCRPMPYGRQTFF